MIINPYVEHTEKTLPNNPMEYIVFGVEGLAFSFIHPDQENPKGYSYYSYGSDKNQFINFAQLMMHEFQDKNQVLKKSVMDYWKFFRYIFPKAKSVRYHKLFVSAF